MRTVTDEYLFNQFRSSPVPVLLMSVANIRCYKALVGDEGRTPAHHILGFYRSRRHTDLTGLPSPCVVLRKSLPNKGKLAILFHEQGHDACREGGCHCGDTNDQAEAERHAYAYALRRLIAEEAWPALEWLVDHVLERSRWPETSMRGRACRNLVKCHVWLEAQKAMRRRTRKATVR